MSKVSKYARPAVYEDTLLTLSLRPYHSLSGVTSRRKKTWCHDDRLASAASVALTSLMYTISQTILVIVLPCACLIASGAVLCAIQAWVADVLPLREIAGSGPENAKRVEYTQAWGPCGENVARMCQAQLYAHLLSARLLLSEGCRGVARRSA